MSVPGVQLKTSNSEAFKACVKSNVIIVLYLLAYETYAHPWLIGAADGGLSHNFSSFFLFLLQLNKLSLLTWPI